MNFMKRGFTSIIRRPGKTVILLIVVFILGNLIAGAISVKESVKNTQKVLRDKIGAVLSIEVDYEKINNSGNYDVQMKSIPVETIDSIGKSEYVKYYDYISRTWLNSSTLKEYRDNSQGDGEVGIFRTKIAAGSTSSVSGITELANFKITGGQNPKISDIVQGNITLYTGRTFNDDEIKNSKTAILISKNLAELNNLSVGQTIKLKKEIYKYISDTNKVLEPTIAEVREFEFNIIGIFEPVKKANVDQNGAVTYAINNYDNMIYTTNAAVNAINQSVNDAERNANGESGVSYNTITPVFVLKEPLKIEDFKTEMAYLLPENYKFTDNSSSFNNISAPMENMDWIASIVLYVSVGSTLIILSLLITLFLRDRKHEIGIYLSLGEKRKNVILQMVMEVICISFVAITLSIFSGNVISSIMSQQMLENQIISDNQNNIEPLYKNLIMQVPSEIEMLGFSATLTNDDLMEAYSVKLGLNTILLFYLVGMGSILLSTLVPIIYVTRLNPKKIMM